MRPGVYFDKRDGRRVTVRSVSSDGGIAKTNRGKFTACYMRQHWVIGIYDPFMKIWKAPPELTSTLYEPACQHEPVGSGCPGGSWWCRKCDKTLSHEEIGL